MPGVQHPTRTGQFHARVSELVTVSPRMRRITLSCPQIAQQDWPLACDIAVVLAGADREMRRRYTVRSVQGEQLRLDAVLHGHGPGASWAQSVRLGDPVSFFGPRGQIELAAADWLLALTDESGLPAIAALAEAAVARRSPLRVLAEVAGPDEQYPLPDGVGVQWLERGRATAGQDTLLGAALDQLDWPAGTGYAYVLGESRAVVALRDRLAERGLPRASVYAKGYWNLNSRPTR